MALQQGDQYAIQIKIKTKDGHYLVPSDIAGLKVTVDDVTKQYPTGVTYNEDLGCWLYQLLQAESLDLDYYVKIQAQISFGGNPALIKNTKVVKKPVEECLIKTAWATSTTTTGNYDLTQINLEIEDLVTTGTKDHSLLDNRDIANQHPISAITNLQTILDTKPNDAPSDDKTYGRKNGNWVEASSAGGLHNDLTGRDVINSHPAKAVLPNILTNQNAFIKVNNAGDDVDYIEEATDADINEIFA